MPDQLEAGFSRLQSISIGVIALLLAAYWGVAWMGMQETQDAKSVEVVQAALQTSVSSGMSVLGLSPLQIHPANLINAARSNFPKGVTVNTQLAAHMIKSGREAQFKVLDNGDVMLVGLKNFSRFHVTQGRIARNSHGIAALDISTFKKMLH